MEHEYHVCLKCFDEITPKDYETFFIVEPDHCDFYGWHKD
jgi:hypothetical protein